MPPPPRLAELPQNVCAGTHGRIVSSAPRPLPRGVTFRRRAVRYTAMPTPRRALRVPEITVWFWIVKALSTAVGESTSDYLVHAMDPVVAVLLGFAGFVVAMALQLAMRRYVASTYWLAVVMVGVFGTMAADVVHVGFGVPYTVSSPLFAVALAAVFVAWERAERTLAIHSVDTVRRELFYWAAVCATFAFGTALGDLTASTLHLGYLLSLVLFAVVIAVPAIAWRWLGAGSVLTFWAAYVVTRPLGASFADWVGKPPGATGLGWGDGIVSVVLLVAIACLVAYLAVRRPDVREVNAENRAPAA